MRFSRKRNFKYEDLGGERGGIYTWNGGQGTNVFQVGRKKSYRHETGGIFPLVVGGGMVRENPSSTGRLGKSSGKKTKGARSALNEDIKGKSPRRLSVHKCSYGL